MKEIMNEQKMETKTTEKYVVVTYNYIHEEGMGDGINYYPQGYKFPSLSQAVDYGFECFNSSEDEFWDCWNEIIFGGFYVTTEDGTPICHFDRCNEDALYRKEVTEKERENKFDFSLVRFEN